MHFRALILATLIAAASLAGCTRPQETADDGNGSTNGTPPTGTGNVTPGAHFRVESLLILHLDGRPGELREDDAGALIRYVVSEPDDAPRAETAFVTYKLNGRIIDTQQVKLEPGKNKTFERRIGELRDNRTIKVEVIAAGSTARAEAIVQDWPRAGASEQPLIFGPLEIRADFGLMEQDGRVLINLTLKNVGPDQPLRDFRAKMLCTLPNGTIRATNSVRLDAPSVNNSTGVDAILDDCGTDTRYGVEFKARGADNVELVSRLLLVPTGWRPPTSA